MKAETRKQTSPYGSTSPSTKAQTPALLGQVQAKASSSHPQVPEMRWWDHQRDAGMCAWVTREYLRHTPAFHAPLPSLHVFFFFSPPLPLLKGFVFLPPREKLYSPHLTATPLLQAYRWHAERRLRFQTFLCLKIRALQFKFQSCLQWPSKMTVSIVSSRQPFTLCLLLLVYNKWLIF